MCAEYKITPNFNIEDVIYPLPRIEESFTDLSGGDKYTRIDLSTAYTQLKVLDKTSYLLAWSIHRGIYRVNRLAFGVKPASAIFQKIMEKTLQGKKGTTIFIDDMVVIGRDDKEHLANLRAVLDSLYEAGYKLNLKKYQ